jgi:hypothetical protein
VGTENLTLFFHSLNPVLLHVAIYRWESSPRRFEGSQCLHLQGKSVPERGNYRVSLCFPLLLQKFLIFIMAGNRNKPSFRKYTQCLRVNDMLKRITANSCHIFPNGLLTNQINVRCYLQKKTT